MINKQTTLDLNGPILSFTQQPQSVTINNGQSTTFVGIATATFPVQDPPNPASNTGVISYRWYAEEFGALTDGSFRGATISGTASTTLTVSNVTNPTTNGIRFYLGADYIPSGYAEPSGAVVTVGTARSTGNATNEPAASSTATLTVRPLVSVVTHPTSATAALDLRANFSVLGSSSDATAVSYRWQLNNNDISDSGNISGSGTPNLSVSLPNESTNTVRARISHPTASNSPIFTNSANFVVFQPRRLIKFEKVGTNGQLTFSDHDLLTGAYVQNGESAVSPAALDLFNVVYAPEKDLRVRITLAGGSGSGYHPFAGTPGQGGVSTFDYTFEKNVEYVFYLATSYPSIDDMFYPGPYLKGWIGGGFSSSLYRKSKLVAVCGGGGAPSYYSNNTTGAISPLSGGSGGGINVAGGGATYRLGGSGRAGVEYRVPGGGYVAPGTFLDGGLDISEYYYSLPSSISSYSNGSRVINTTGVSASSDFPGLTKLIVSKIGYLGDPYTSPYTYVGYNGPQSTTTFTASDSASIFRGHKLGYPYGYRFNGGQTAGTGGAFNGTGSGAGARPGGYEFFRYVPTGGGSGYHDGSISLVSTQLGGNSSPAGYIRIQSI